MTLAAPTLTHPYSTPTTIRLTWTDASGGTGPYVYDVHRSTTNGFTPTADTLLAADQSSPYDDADAALRGLTVYRYKVVVTDAVLATVASGQVSGALEYATPVAGAATMALSAGRAWVKQFGRNAGDSSMYDAAQIDRAIQMVCSRFCRVTRAVKSATSAVLVVGDTTFSLSTFDPLTPENLMEMTLSDVAEPLEVVPYTDLHRLRVECPRTAKPTKAAALGNDVENGTFTLYLYPTNDAIRSVDVQYWRPFPLWTPGVDVTDPDDDPGLLLPRQWLAEILTYGVPAALQHNEPEHKYAGPTWEKYLEFERSMMGAGSLGERVVRRARVGDCRR